MKKVARLFLNRKLLIINLLVLFFVFPGNAGAQTPPDPNPEPCAFPKETSNLSRNPILSDTGDAPISIAYEFDAKGGQYRLPAREFTFKIDFSKLQAIFAPNNSDYLEGNFQDQSHQTQSVSDLNSQGLNQYFGPNQKTSPKVITNQLKINYINYVTNRDNNGNSHLPEAANKITDINGQNPRTIYDLVQEFGWPQQDPTVDQDRDAWGKYWLKIPTAWSEFYSGYIDFLSAKGQKQVDDIKTRQCVSPPFGRINIVLPEYFRTTQVSDQTSRVMLPLNVQRDPTHEILGANFNGSVLAKGINFCKDLLSKIPTSLGETFGKVLKVSLKLLDPIKPVYAQGADTVCVTVTANASGGQAPYCPLPPGEIYRINNTDGMSVNCTNPNPNDQFNLQKSNQNVVCTFTLRWQDEGFPFVVEEGPDCTRTGTDQYHCKLEVKIWPVLNLPWTAEVWNNTIYGSGPNRKNPGIYSNFIPSSVIGQKPLPKLDKPANTEGASDNIDPRIRNLGAVNCAQKFVRDLALKPKALQEIMGINVQCSN